MSNIDVVIDRANAMLNRGDYWGAIEEFTQALRCELPHPRHAGYAIAFNGRASARVLVGDYDGAILDLQKAANIFIEGNQLEYYKKAMQSIQQIRATRGW